VGRAKHEPKRRTRTPGSRDLSLEKAALRSVSKGKNGERKRSLADGEGASVSESSDSKRSTQTKGVTDAEQTEQIHALKDRIKHGEWWMIALTAAMVGLGVMQYWLTKTQIADAKAAVELDQRAWIVVSNIQGTPVPGKTLKPTVFIKNIGKTTAFDVNIRSRFYVLAAGERLKYPTEYGPASGTAIDGVLPPVGEATIGEELLAGDNKTPLLLTQQIIDDWKANKFRVVLIGRVMYKDIFNRPHFLKYCYSYLPEGDWINCNMHNEFDH